MRSCDSCSYSGRNAGPHCDLVFHQGDQRRDHDSQPAGDQRRYLETQRLARPGRHHGQDIATREQRIDDFFLSRPERIEAEDILQDAILVARFDKGLGRR